MKSYDVYFFDLDGTITDSSLGITNSVMYALKKFGITETDRTKLYKFIGPPLTDSFREFYGFSEEEALLGVKYYREYYQDKGIYENLVYDGLEEIIKTLKAAGKTTVVATSKPEPYAKRIIEHFGLAPYFDHVAGMELSGERATKAEVIRYAFEKCGLDVHKKKDREKVLMVGDRKHDVIGAHEVGIDCLGVLYGFGSRKELEEAGADYIVETVGGIQKIILDKKQAK